VLFVVDKVEVGQVFSKYFGFHYQFSFHRLFHTHPHLSSGAGTIGQLVDDVPSGLSLTPPQEKKVALEKVYFEVLVFSPANDPSTTALYSSITPALPELRDVRNKSPDYRVVLGLHLLET
jgi:hypothetical protein